MISSGSASSRPVSSIPVAGTSQAIANSTGSWVTAANTHPGSHHQRRDRRRTAAAAEISGASTAGADRALVDARSPVTAPPPSPFELSRTDPADSPSATPSPGSRRPRSRRRTSPTVDRQPQPTVCAAQVKASAQTNDMERFTNWHTWPRTEPELRRLLPASTCDLVGKAVEFALRHHGDQRRPTGAPYLEHLLEALEFLVRG